MSKFLKYFIQGKKIFDTPFGLEYLDGVIYNHTYTQVLHLHKNGKPDDFVFKGWTLNLVAHDMSETTCKLLCIPYNKATVRHIHGISYCRYYFLLAKNKQNGKKYLIPVDTHTFARMDNAIVNAPKEWICEKWLREELNEWVAGLCNTDADITEWRYLRRFFAWWKRLINDIMRCDYA